jgi:hypothetical protein
VENDEKGRTIADGMSFDGAGNDLGNMGIADGVN